VILSDGPAICPPDLGLKQSQAKQHFIGNEQRQSNEQRPTMSLENYFQHFVLSHQEQLSETELAKRLGISRKSLWERRNRLGIPKHRDGDLLE
jgi:DNA-binding NtrC family response regulator